MNRMIRTHVIFAILCLSPFVANAHVHGPKLWIEHSSDIFLSRDVITDGNIRIYQGFFGSFDLEKLVKDNPDSMALIDKQQQFLTYAHLTYWLGAIPSAFVFGFGIGLQNVIMIGTSAATLIGTGILTGHFVSKSRYYMFEAINKYNDVSARPMPVALNTNIFNLQFEF
jgi:hypothetical protein